MQYEYEIDIDFDFRSDTPTGKDPDARSRTLRGYHQQLWSKPLPNGKIFDLTTTTPKVYLHHKSEMGEFKMSSDSVIPTFNQSTRIAHVMGQISPEQHEQFLRLSYTIGGMMIFPANKISGRMTINGERGCNYRIKDRFDLTVECIRRHYLNEQSPLSDCLARYDAFFRLFDDFRGYIDFFLLQDIISDDYSSIKFFAPFEDFLPWPLPNNVSAYLSYREQAESFIRARNCRILISVRTSATSL